MKYFKVLLIEPDHLLATIYKEYLEKFNYKVRICNNSQVAIDLIDENIPDVIVLEPQLNGHNGFEFLYELRSYPEWLHIPVLIHSMISEQELDISTISKLELGITAYMYKPSATLGKLHYELNKQLLVSSV